MKIQQCSVCDRRFSFFRWRYRCAECEKTVCKSCLVPMQRPEEMRQGRYDVYDVCKVCASNIEQQIENDPVLKASRDAYQKGVEAGYEKGHKKGYNEGYIDGDL